MKSTFLSLNTRDFLKGLVMFVGTPVLYLLQELIPGYGLHPLLQAAISATITYLLKNLFTDDSKVAEKIADENDAKIVPKSAKIVPIVLLLIAFSFSATAQSFFKPIPPRNKAVKGRTASSMPSSGMPSFWAIRPIASAVSLFIDGAVEAAAGGGISYQNITQDVDGRNYVNYAFSALMLAGGSVVPDNPSDIGKFGVMISALNNTVGVGYGMSNRLNTTTNEKKWKGGLMIAWTVNFNN